MFKISKKTAVLSILAVAVFVICTVLVLTRKKTVPYEVPVPAVTIAKPVKGKLSEAITISIFIFRPPFLEK